MPLTSRAELRPWLTAECEQNLFLTTLTILALRAGKSGAAPRAQAHTPPRDSVSRYSTVCCIQSRMLSVLDIRNIKQRFRIVGVPFVY